MKVLTRRRVLLGLVVASNFVFAACGRAIKEPRAYLQPGAADLAPYLQAVGKECHIPGMSAVVLRGDRIIAQGVFGVRRDGAPDRVERDDRFHLGSNTKSMTATLAGMLVDEGKLKWSATLGELFGDVVPNLNPAWRNVTLAQVLSHQSGLPANFSTERGDPPADSARSLPEQRRALVAHALTQAPNYPPGSKVVYSNIGFTLVGATLEKITGQAWEDLMRERLFQPLGITTGGFGPPHTPGKADAPWGHRTALLLPHGGDNPPVIGPAGTVHMSVPDWAKFVTLHLRGDAGNLHRETKLLTPATFDWLHSPEGGNQRAGWVRDQAPAFKGGKAGDTGKLLWHNGSNGAWYAIMYLAPEKDLAVLIAANRFNPDITKACDQGARALLRFYAATPAAK